MANAGALDSFGTLSTLMRGIEDAVLPELSAADRASQESGVLPLPNPMITPKNPKEKAAHGQQSIAYFYLLKTLYVPDAVGELEKIIAKYGEDVLNCQGRYNRTPAFGLFQNPDPAVVRAFLPFLVEKGMRLQIPDLCGQTCAFLIPSNSLWTEVLKYLVEYHIEIIIDATTRRYLCDTAGKSFMERFSAGTSPALYEILKGEALDLGAENKDLLSNAYQHYARNAWDPRKRLRSSDVAVGEHPIVQGVFSRPGAGAGAGLGLREAGEQHKSAFHAP